MSSEWAGVDGGGSVAPSMSGSTQQAAGIPATWWNPLSSPAIDARRVAGGLWAWRAQANDNVTWGPGPANYAASLISVEGGATTLVEIGGGPVNWAALVGWSGFSALNRALDTTINCGLNYAVFVQFTNAITGSGTRTFFGAFVATTNVYLIRNLQAVGGVQYWNGGGAALGVVPEAVNGNLAILSKTGYRNSVFEGNLPAGGIDNTISSYIGALHFGAGGTQWHQTEIQAVLIIDDWTVITAADRNAIAASPGGSMFNL